jgi:hypothetical protein
VQLRTDAELGTDRLTPAAQSDFAFVYIPYATEGFIGGMVEGYSGDLMDGAKVLCAWPGRPPPASECRGCRSQYLLACGTVCSCRAVIFEAEAVQRRTTRTMGILGLKKKKRVSAVILPEDHFGRKHILHHY